jgi:hypothetical protein
MNTARGCVIAVGVTIPTVLGAEKGRSGVLTSSCA